MHIYLNLVGREQGIFYYIENVVQIILCTKFTNNVFFFKRIIGCAEHTLHMYTLRPCYERVGDKGEEEEGHKEKEE